MQANILLLLSITIAGCSPIAPKVEISKKLLHGIDSRIYITAAREKDDIIKSMRNAGFNIVEHLEDSDYLMRGTIGIDQDSSSCGTFNNVSYQLRAENQTVVEAKAKGWLGTCQPNVLDEVSREMRRQIIESTEK